MSVRCRSRLIFASNQLHVHLAPLERNGVVCSCDDSRIAAGTKWRDEIHKALKEAKVAAHLVSPHFMASEFNQSDELPQLLCAAQSQGVTILPVVVRPCIGAKLGEFLFINRLDKPLFDMRSGDRDRTWIRVVEAITAVLNV